MQLAAIAQGGVSGVDPLPLAVLAIIIAAGLILSGLDMRESRRHRRRTEARRRPSPRPRRDGVDDWWEGMRAASAPTAGDGHDRLNLAPAVRAGMLADCEAIWKTTLERSGL